MHTHMYWSVDEILKIIVYASKEGSDLPVNPPRHARAFIARVHDLGTRIKAKSKRATCIKGQLGLPI